MTKPDDRKHIRLRVIPEPVEGTRAVLVPGPDTPKRFTYIRGQHPGYSYDCGKCGTPLMLDMLPGQVQGIVLRCAYCLSYNESSVYDEKF